MRNGSLVRIVEMTYIRADGSLVQRRSWYRISLISDLFWGVVDVFGLLFSTLFHPTRQVRSEERRVGKEC